MSRRTNSSCIKLPIICPLDRDGKIQKFHQTAEKQSVTARKSCFRHYSHSRTANNEKALSRPDVTIGPIIVDSRSASCGRCSRPIAAFRQKTEPRLEATSSTQSAPRWGFFFFLRLPKRHIWLCETLRNGGTHSRCTERASRLTLRFLRVAGFLFSAVMRSTGAGLPVWEIGCLGAARRWRIGSEPCLGCFGFCREDATYGD